MGHARKTGLIAVVMAYTLALKSHSTDTVVYTSKEGGGPPQLVFTTG